MGERGETLCSGSALSSVTITQEWSTQLSAGSTRAVGRGDCSSAVQMSPFDSLILPGSRNTCWTSALCAAVVLSISALARANGRYPLAQQLLVDPSDAGHLFLRSTYGVLTSSDGGAAWSWMCESGIGYDPGEDPMMTILGDGSVLAGASEGLFTTRDRGCSWPKDSTIGDTFVRDLATESDGVVALALTVAVQPDGRYATSVWRSPDGAHTFTDLGSVSSGSALPFTLDAAPADSQRLYVTAATPSSGDAGAAVAPGVLFRSKDGGATWTETPIPGTDRQNAPYIGRVDPTNPDALYVRVQGDWDGTNPVESWLLYTDDAGDTWREIFRAKADMLGFTLGPDPTTVLVGMGDTHSTLRPVDTTALGLYRATSPSFTFTHLGGGQVGCLTYSGQTLYVCGGQAEDGYELGVSSNDGATVSPLFQYGTVTGPLACPSDSPQATVCGSQWGIACRGLGSCPHFDGGTGSSTGSNGGGCCGSATPAPNRTQTGTAQLDMLAGPESKGIVLAAAAAASLLRRLARRRRSAR